MLKIRNLIIILILIAVFPGYPNSQSVENRKEKVYRYCYVVKAKEWYQNQEKLWRAEIMKNQQDEDAWYNYFFAARYGYSNIKGQTNPREVLMDSIYNEMGKAIPDSWVYHYIHYYNYGTDPARLYKAYEINPYEPDLFWEMIRLSELNGNQEGRAEFCHKLYDSKAIAAGILSLNYNMLNSAQPNSILITNGDNDTYPAWILQDAKGVRTDVLILNIHAIFGDRAYLKSKLIDKKTDIDSEKLSDSQVPLFLEKLLALIDAKYPEKPLHIAQTVHNSYYENIKNKLYLTGLVFTYGTAPANENIVHRDIIESNLKLDYLDTGWYGDLHVSQPLVLQLNLFYVKPFLKLAKYFHSSGEFDSAINWKNKALSIAKKAESDETIKMIEEIGW